MVVTAAIVLLPLCLTFSAQVGHGAKQDISLERRIAQLQQRIAERPRDPDLHFELSKLYEEDVERYYDESLSEFGLAFKNRNKGETVQWNELSKLASNAGTILAETGQYDDALKRFKSAVDLDPDCPYPYSSIGAIYSIKGEMEQAIKYSNKSIDLYHYEKMFHLNVGAIYVNKGDYELALLSFRKIEIIDPKYKGHYFDVARAYHGLGQYDKAIDALDRGPREWRKNDTVKEFRKECVKLLRQSN